MKILVKHRNTHLYLTQAARWTPQEKDASTFQSFIDVLALCNLHHITDCEIQYIFRESEYSFSIDWNPQLHRLKQFEFAPACVGSNVGKI